MTRRQFMLGAAAAAAAALLPRALQAAPPPVAPRWRGFNLTEMSGWMSPPRFEESDFALMAEWGFNFARLPVSYWCWSQPAHWEAIDERALVPLDEAIEWGRQYGIHLNLCLHRIPGYCVNEREREPEQLFTGKLPASPRALAVAVQHWEFLARRYRQVPSGRLSFDLLNEPPFMTEHTEYVQICRALIAAIRAVSPERLIFVDGADIGQTPVLALLPDNVIQSTRGYLPKMVSHYTAQWVPEREFESREVPTWPMTDQRGIRWDKEKLRAELIEKWQPLVRRGGRVHVGEWGCYSRTPHAACLGWMTDMLDLWQEAGWGWSMWNLRGDFGVMDSRRSDVKYESFHGHQLDRRMLELLLSH
ncbi:MAG: cellulase family glycosylhydrolase [Opitutae bacterium]|nr:cellulase family glycosylhydrolase [Opitutae bacterium]